MSVIGVRTDGECQDPGQSSSTVTHACVLLDSDLAGLMPVEDGYENITVFSPLKQ